MSIYAVWSLSKLTQRINGDILEKKNEQRNKVKNSQHYS